MHTAKRHIPLDPIKILGYPINIDGADTKCLNVQLCEDVRPSHVSPNYKGSTNSHIVKDIVETSMVKNGIIDHNTSNLSLKAVVLSECWSSFTMVLESSGFDVDTYTKDKLNFDELILGKVCKNLPKLMNSFTSSIHDMHSSDTSIWLQGSKEFIETMIEIICNHFTSVTSVCSNLGRKNIKPRFQLKKYVGHLNQIKYITTINDIIQGKQYQLRLNSCKFLNDLTNVFKDQNRQQKINCILINMKYSKF
jgi:hypothetical protein